VFTLVIYDISTDKDRTRLSKALENVGLRRIQYSAFSGELNPHDRHALSKDIKRYVRSENDSIYILPLCERCKNVSEIISKKDVALVDESKVQVV
jgi:CRISPR-associated protein Cas2